MVQNHFENEDEDDLDFRSVKGFHRIENQSKNTKRKQNKSNISPDEIGIDLGEGDYSMQNFSFQYSASRYEQGWLIESLGNFYEQHWIKDVTRIIKGGKEASVYQCLPGDSIDATYLAAKVYRPRQFRNLKNDYIYRENRAYLDENGHFIHDSRMGHAIKKKTDFGKQLTHISWIEHEINTMKILKSAGADVPEPYASGNNAILMTYLGGDDIAAPTLNEINLPVDLARRLFDRIIFNIELMLANNRIHADLSAYNILFWDDEITIIDFPQAINPLENQNSWKIFNRDVTRICQYFQNQKVDVEPNQLARSMWGKHRFPSEELFVTNENELEIKEVEDTQVLSNAVALGL